MESKNPITRASNYIKNLWKKHNPAISKTAEGGVMYSNYWFTTEIQKIKYTDRIRRVNQINDYLGREHKVLEIPNFEFKEKTFEPCRLILQTLKSIIKFHASYICGSPISITGDKEFVSHLNKIYKRGGYHKVDLELAKDLITYGDCFEYVYLDENNNIKSKVIRNSNAYPIYTADGEYINFVEYYKDEDTRADMYVVYYPDRVDTYKNRELIDSKVNLTGLPIWYSGMDKSKYDKFGDPFPYDLIPVMDTIEDLLSKLDTSVLTLSLNPLGVVSGQRIDSSIDRSIAGAVLNLEDGSKFEWVSADMDRESIKLILDYTIQQFYAIGCIPASLLGQSNVANVSETSITMLFQQTDNFCREYILSLTEGLYTRLKYFRKLMELKGETVTDDVYDSVNFEFNVARPVDTQADFENMKIQFDCGALSRRTFIDKSKYTTNTALELQRLSDEAEGVQSIEESEDTPVSGTETEKAKLDNAAD